MPTYQYTCTACGEDLEAVQRFTDDALTECPACGGRLRKVYGSVGVVFKGSGFYKTDSRGSSGGATLPPEKKEPAKASSDSSTSSSDSSSSSSSSATPAKDSGTSSSSAGSSSTGSSSGKGAAA